MRTEKVKVAIWGFGAMGSGMARMILAKKGFEIAAVCDNRPDFVNKSVFALLDIDRESHPDCVVQADINDAIKGKKNRRVPARDRFLHREGLPENKVFA